MGSPIDTWEGAEAYFTGAGGFTPMLFLFIAIALCIALIVHGSVHEEHAYKKKK